MKKDREKRREKITDAKINPVDAVDAWIFA